MKNKYILNSKDELDSIRLALIPILNAMAVEKAKCVDSFLDSDWNTVRVKGYETTMEGPDQFPSRPRNIWRIFNLRTGCSFASIFWSFGDISARYAIATPMRFTIGPTNGYGMKI
jgi:hypothetical protein